MKLKDKLILFFTTIIINSFVMTFMMTMQSQESVSLESVLKSLACSTIGIAIPVFLVLGMMKFLQKRNLKQGSTK